MSICAPGAAPKAIASTGTRMPAARAGRPSSSNGGAEAGRWAGAERVGAADVRAPTPSPSIRRARWGLAARGAMVEAGTPEFDFHLVDKVEVWADDAARIYAQAVAAQWDPETAIPWKRRIRPRRRGRRRGRPDHDVSDRERDRRADRAEPLHRAAPSAFPRGDAGARGAGRRRGPPHRGVHPARAAQARRSWACRRSAARRRSRRWSTSPTSRSRPFCSRCSARARFCRCSGSSSATRPIRSRRRSPGSPRRTKRGTSRSVSRISASICAREPGFRPRLADAIRRRHDALRHTAGLNDGGLRRAAPDGRRLVGARRSAARDIGACMQLMRDMDEDGGSA